MKKATIYENESDAKGKQQSMVKALFPPLGQKETAEQLCYGVSQHPTLREFLGQGGRCSQ